MTTPHRVFLALAVVVAACGGGGDGAVDGAAADAPRVIDGSTDLDAPAPITFVDVAVSGCAALGGVPRRCDGEVPLALTFAIVASGPVDGALWDFGDGSPPVTELAPRHVYTRPGAFDVTLSVRGPGGTAQAHLPGLIVSSAAGIGGACSEAVGCDGDLECLCAGGVACPAPLARGLCTRPCTSDDDCGAAAACVDLGHAGDEAPWQTRVCLETCVAGDGGCGAGLGCQALPRVTGGWVEACFAPGVVAPDGAACRDASGGLRDDACASGRCLELGARGVCAADCVGGCAAGTTCAQVGGGVGAACLAECASAACDGDPWLACEAPEVSGAWGFTIDGVPKAGGYCAPKRCGGGDVCGDGVCGDRGGASFCGPAPI